jgi:hypothetical protein
VTPPELRRHLEGLGFNLSLRPGGLRLSGAAAPPTDLLGLIADHRVALLALLEAEALIFAAHDASLAADRVTVFPEHLARLVHPSLVRACAQAEARRQLSLNGLR